MTIIAFHIEVELSDEDTIPTAQLDKALVDMEDLLMRHPAGFELYDSEWYNRED